MHRLLIIAEYLTQYGYPSPTRENVMAKLSALEWYEFRTGLIDAASQGCRKAGHTMAPETAKLWLRIIEVA